MSVKIRKLIPPEGDLSRLDPGGYICDLEFYETSDNITEEDREGLAELLHYLAYIALTNKSEKWASSTISKNTSAYLAIEHHFGSLDGWGNLIEDNGINYKKLVSLLMPIYPPGSTKI